jgi:hypothetical protein
MFEPTPESDPVPAYNSPGDVTLPHDVVVESRHRNVDPIIVPAFFDSIRAGDVERVTRYLDAHPSLAHSSLSRENYFRGGQSPLYAATIAGNTYIVALLAQRGAPIDELSFTGEYSDSEPVLRTPLMAAASRGSLVLVKLLYNDLKADDSIVAPDGAIALRLAVEGKHTEIVALLPTRRKGGWRRFKHSHRKAWRRIKKAGYAIYEFGRFFLWQVPKFFLWYVPKYFLWTLPKEYLPNIGRRVVRAVKEFPDTMKFLGKLLWARLLAIPSYVVKFAEKLWIAIKGIPSFCVEFAKGIWYLVKLVVKWLWKMTTQIIPQALFDAGKFAVRTLVSAVKFVWQFMKDVVSFLHTLVVAIITRFTSVTLNDVLRALSVVFVSVPKWIWSTICKVAVAIKNGIVTILEGMGDVISFLVMLPVWLVIYVPRKVVKILVGCGEIASAGAREVAWWINPKWRATMS